MRGAAEGNSMKNARGLKKGDLIKCTDGREVARMLKILGDEGYHAVSGRKKKAHAERAPY